jgi:hypothetical protein
MTGLTAAGPVATGKIGVGEAQQPGVGQRGHHLYPSPPGNMRDLVDRIKAVVADPITRGLISDLHRGLA